VQIHEGTPVRQPKLGIELQERVDHEGALGQSRVRDLEARLADDLVAVEQEIEVDRAGTPPLLAGTVAAEAPLDLEQAVEELARTQVRLDLGGPVHEPRLVDVPDRIRLAEGRDGDDRDPVQRVQAPERLPERRLPVAEVRPEADVSARPRNGHAEMLISEGMRPAGVLSLAVLVALVVAGTGTARTPQERAHIQARASLDRAQAIFRGEGTDPRGATMALRDLRLRIGSLTSAERAVARSLLARPTDGGGFNWSAPKTARKHLCATHFCVHWVTKTADAPNPTDKNHNHKPDYVDSVKSVMTTVWNKEIAELDYRAPLADGNSGSHHGGNPNNRIDIFLQDLGNEGLYGFCTTDDPRFSQQSNLSAYCVFDDDFSKSQFPFGAHGVAALKVTAAHEFQHASQFAYDFREDRWFLEATAVNMEATVYPGIHDNYQYFPSSPLSKSNPWRPIDLFQTNGTNQYGSWIFFRFLCEIYTPHPIVGQPDCSVVKDLWERAAVNKGTKAGGTYSTKAITDELTADGQDFVDLFRQFGAANADPAAIYKDGALYPKAASNSTNYPMNPVNPAGAGLTTVMFHMSNDYVKVKPGASANSLTIDADFPASPFTPRATALIYDENGALTTTEIPLVNGNGSLGPMAFDTGSVSKIIVVITNAGTRFNCNHGTNLSCKGDPLDDSPGISNSSAPDDYIVDFNVS
jgi:hypothetical protein